MSSDNGDERQRRSRRVVVVDPRPIVGAGVAAIVASPSNAVPPSMAARLSPGDGLALVSMSTPDLPGVISILSRRGRRSVVYGPASETALGAALAAGAVGHLPDDAATEDMLGAIDRLSAGVPSLFDPEERARLISLSMRARVDSAGRRDGLAALTKRELEVLAALAGGKRPAEIAATDFVSVNTVRNQVQSILVKLNAHSQLEAVAIAHRHGWIPDAA